MKILHFHPNGRMAALFIDPLIEGERKAGHDSELITSSIRSKTSTLEIRYDLSLRNLPLLPFSLFRICRLIHARKPDVVISHNTKSSPLPLFAAWLMRVKSRIYFNHGVPYVGYNGTVRWVLKLLESINGSLATKVLTVSRDMVRLLTNVRESLDPSVILNGSACGLDLDVYNKARYLDSRWRQEHGINKDDVLVVFVGRPERRKGFERALHVWKDYLTNPKYKLLLCGATPADVLRFLPEVPDNVTCLGFISNIPEILSNSDILIMPSLHEGLSYAVLEAMACGCVVIVNDIEGIRSLVSDKNNGYLVKDNALATYAQLIERVAQGGEDIDLIRQEAQATVNMFSRKLFIPAYIAFLNDINTSRP
ncbi:glycosyltransferase [Herbaspirillum sp. LeCh32-8]|uniref:glycosyltransferase n=1 Tax=Herbaspirillum sp. LeCh32-8 TaxID=2821356 RepID=UPI001AEB63D7|nr:glycosyltransferase [Herbaspirillum sp. LeCh32-8]MBP0598341.1 glycosyltransferase [Herbaspirillum sp. LeCh32-8]